jgi:hypothetical protein
MVTDGRHGGYAITDRSIRPSGPEDEERFNELIRISRGGQLYDNWWKTTVDTEKPKGDHPLWKKQTR